MKKFKLLFNSITLLLLSILFLNCSDNSNDESFVKLAKVNELSFIEIPAKNLNGSKSELTTDNYLEFVFFDGIPAKEFMVLNNIDKDEFLVLIEKKIEDIEINNFENKSQILEKDPPTLEEIRNAMIEECENGYCCGLDDACVLAVKIAYWIKKAQQ